MPVGQEAGKDSGRLIVIIRATRKDICCIRIHIYIYIQEAAADILQEQNIIITEGDIKRCQPFRFNRNTSGQRPNQSDISSHLSL